MIARRSLGEPRDEAERLTLISRARQNWTNAITATDRAVANGKSGANAMRSERHWMTEYRRLGGKLPANEV